jgi:hypothetical protein
MKLKMNIAMDDYEYEYLLDMLIQRAGDELRRANEARTDVNPEEAAHHEKLGFLATNLVVLLFQARWKARRRGKWTAGLEEAMRGAPSQQSRPRRPRRVRGSNVHGRESSAPAGKPPEV